jgi:hypothetical protein
MGSQRRNVRAAVPSRAKARAERVARQPLSRLLKGVKGPRELAARSRGLVAGAFDYARLVKEGKVPGPLLLTLRAANELARRIQEQPSPTPTRAQRLTLLAAGAQLRALSSRIIVSTDSNDPQSVEAELAELIRRTLTLIDRVTAESPAISASQNGPDARQVIDTEGWPAPRLSHTAKPED